MTFLHRDFFFNGRRAKLGDLIDAGLLKPGQQLFYTQKHGQPPHRGVVTEDGQIELADGQKSPTPSGAATAAAKHQVDGWPAWRVGDPEKGPSLRDLRDKLIGTEVVLDIGRPGARVTITLGEPFPQDQPSGQRWRHAQIQVEAAPFAGTIQTVLAEKYISQYRDHAEQFAARERQVWLGDDHAPLVILDRHGENVEVTITPPDASPWPHLRFLITPPDGRP